MIQHKKINPIHFFLLVLMACGQRNGSNTDNFHDNVRDQSASDPKVENICFAYLGEKDTVRLQIDQKADGKVKGVLVYKLFEKDLNSGSFEGEMSGDTLIAEYSFAAEGKRSKREVAFLFRDNLVLEGYGPVKEEDGVFRFETPNELEFGQGIQLLRINCEGGG